jgi:DNA-binding XRE family transcriptional regulator
VLVPEKTRGRMIEDLDDLDDIRAYDRAVAKPQELIPAEVADRLIARENPVRVWRRYRDLTQQQLAQKSRIRKSYLSQLESGAREASLSVLKRLAVALKLDVDDLI